MNECDLFIDAMKLDDEAEQVAFLEKACAGDTELKQRVEALINAYDQAGSFLTQPTSETVATLNLPQMEKLGSQIGRYKLREVLGEGGMGTVYVAQQERPVRRKVALKLIKLGMDSRDVISRFEAERQALALMDHPNIASVLDAGVTQSGRPYFVMELVKGLPITEHCDLNRLVSRERLELFLQVCRALQHAHQKGIIHRDLKPSNVLVAMHDTIPVVKVIDFGVAKAIGQQLTEKTLYTAIGQMVGTPMYMSPEQAGQSSIDVDTRSDVYSLGVLLYELLTGCTPFEKETLKQAAYDEMRRIIQEVDPPRPSTRFSSLNAATSSTIANSRQTEPHKLSQHLRGELDWIVMKALEKERTRRYESATALAADIDRYLRDQPVLAGPPSTMYRFRKFVIRNLAGIAISLALLVSSLIALASIVYFSYDRLLKRETTLAIANEALREVEERFRSGQTSEALFAVSRAQSVLALVPFEEQHAKVLKWKKDLEMVQRLDDIRLEASSSRGDIIESAQTDRAYTKAFCDFGLDPSALDEKQADLLSQEYAIRFELASAIDVWSDHRRLCSKSNDDSWKELLKIAMAIDHDPLRTKLRKAVADDDKVVLMKIAEDESFSNQSPSTQCLLGSILCRYEEPSGTARLILAQELHPNDFWINYQLAFNKRKLNPGDPADALRYFQAAVALRPQSTIARTQLAIALFESGKEASAFRTAQKAIDLDPGSAIARLTLGKIYCRTGQYDNAITSFRKAIRLNNDYAAPYIILGNTLARATKINEAIEIWKAASVKFPERSEPNFNLGITYREIGDLDASEEEFRALMPRFPTDANIRVELCRTLAALNRIDDAVAEAREAVGLAPTDSGTHVVLAQALAQNNESFEAQNEFHESIRLRERDYKAHFGLCELLFQQGFDTSDSVHMFELAVKGTNDVLQRCEGEYFLALTYLLIGERPKAEVSFSRANIHFEQAVFRDDELRGLKSKVAQTLDRP